MVVFKGTTMERSGVAINAQPKPEMDAKKDALKIAKDPTSNVNNSIVSASYSFIIVQPVS